MVKWEEEGKRKGYVPEMGLYLKDLYRYFSLHKMGELVGGWDKGMCKRYLYCSHRK